MIRPPRCYHCRVEDYYRARRMVARDSGELEWVYYCRHCGGLAGRNRKLFYGHAGGSPTLSTPWPSSMAAKDGMMMASRLDTQSKARLLLTSNLVRGSGENDARVVMRPMAIQEVIEADSGGATH